MSKFNNKIHTINYTIIRQHQNKHKKQLSTVNDEIVDKACNMPEVTFDRYAKDIKAKNQIFELTNKYRPIKFNASSVDDLPRVIPMRQLKPSLNDIL